MKLIDPKHPFYRPAWRRYLIVAACFGWAFFEFGMGNEIWGYLFAAIGGYLAWQLVFGWKEDGGDGS